MEQASDMLIVLRSELASQMLKTSSGVHWYGDGNGIAGSGMKAKPKSVTSSGARQKEHQVTEYGRTTSRHVSATI
jgi:surface antigen